MQREDIFRELRQPLDTPNRNPSQNSAKVFYLPTTSLLTTYDELFMAGIIFHQCLLRIR